MALDITTNYTNPTTSVEHWGQVVLLPAHSHNSDSNILRQLMGHDTLQISLSCLDTVLVPSKYRYC